MRDGNSCQGRLVLVVPILWDEITQGARESEHVIERDDIQSVLCLLRVEFNYSLGRERVLFELLEVVRLRGELLPLRRILLQALVNAKGIEWHELVEKRDQARDAHFYPLDCCKTLPQEDPLINYLF